MPPSIEQLKKGFRNPKSAIGYFGKPFYRNTCVRISSRIQIGTHVMAQDWDVLVLLDACRLDALREVENEYEFLENIDKTLSIGGSSPEWMVHTFDEKWQELFHSTAYLSANAWTERVLDDRLQPDGVYNEYQILNRLKRFGEWNLAHPDDFGRIEKIWKYVPAAQKITERHDPDNLMPGGAPPRFVTDRAISVSRELRFDQMIIHYIQPHVPYMANATREKRELYEYEQNPFDYIRRTNDRESVWNAYLDELRYVLDDLSILLDNMDAETVVITADHGEAFGEYGVYNHHTGSLHPNIRIIPWVTTSAVDSGSYTPERELKERDQMSVDESLEALGYLS